MSKKYRLMGLRYDEALELIHRRFPNLSSYIDLPVTRSIGYISWDNIRSTMDLPPKDIAFYDGYAVNSSDLRDASPDNPVRLRVIAKILRFGDEEGVRLRSGCTAYVSANSPIPSGADAVARVELVKDMSEYIELRRPIKPGTDIVYRGEDLSKDDIVVKRGRIIRPQDVALLMELGIYRVKVFRRPRAALYGVGDELLDELSRGKPYPDNYSYLAYYLLKYMGVDVDLKGILRDDPDQISSEISESIKCYDMALLVGGASIGLRDYTGPALGDIGEPLFHGTNLTPGKVSGVYVVDGKPVFLVPGHIGSNVSCLYNIVYPYVRDKFYDGYETIPVIKARIGEEPDVRPGRYTVRTVSLRIIDGTIYAYPFKRRLGGSTLLSILTNAYGLITIPPDSRPKRGDTINVMLFTPMEIYNI